MARKILFLPFTAIPAASFAVGYTRANQPASEAFQGLTVVSSLNQDVFVSFDGVNDHLFLRSGQSQFLNASFLDSVQNASFAKFQDIWFRQGTVAPATGNLFLERLYVEPPI